MAKSKGKHVSDKEQYASYKVLDKRQNNREARLARHAKNHPNDAQASKAAKVKAFKSKPGSKGNFPAAKTKLTHPITGQPMVAFALEAK